MYYHNYKSWGDTTICQGSSIQLLASGSNDVTQYSWDTNAAGLSCYNNCNNPFATPITTTTYTVTIDAGGDCIVTDSITVTVDDDSLTLGDDRTICEGDAVQLNAQTGGTVTWLVTNDLSCTNCPNPLASPSITTTYIAQASTANGCVLGDTITVNVLTPAIVDAGADSIICVGTSITLNGTGIGTISWSPSATLNDATILTPIATPLDTTDYILTIQEDACTLSDTVRIAVISKVDIAANDIEICADEFAIVDIQGLTDNLTFTPIDGLTIGNPIIVQPNQTTTYTVVGDYSTCESDTTTFTVTVNPVPDIGLYPNMVVLQNSTNPILMASPNANYSYTWTPDSLLSCADCHNPFLTVGPNFDSLTIYVDILSDDGCSLTDSITAVASQVCGQLVVLPDAFTPNGDGVNDVLQVRSTGATSIEIFQIYNRWGQKLFETTDIDDAWDGTYQGQPVQAGTYFYIIKCNCSLTGEDIIYQGDITLHY